MERGKGETRGVPTSPECSQTKHKVHNGVRRKGPVAVPGCISEEKGEPADNNCLQKKDTHRSLHPFHIQPPPKHQTRSHEVPENPSGKDM